MIGERSDSLRSDDNSGRSYRDLFQFAGSSEMARGMAQLKFTAPFYAAAGYSIGAFIGMRSEVPRFTAAWRRLKPTLKPASPPQSDAADA